MNFSGELQFFRQFMYIMYLCVLKFELPELGDRVQRPGLPSCFQFLSGFFLFAVFAAPQVAGSIPLLPIKSRTQLLDGYILFKCKVALPDGNWQQ